jgi:hypothetical protein
MENKQLEKTEDKKRLPSIQDLIEQNADTYKQTALTVLLNQNPPAKWIKKHPVVSIEIEVEGQKQKVPMPYIPIDKIEYALTRIFTRWWVEVKSCVTHANSEVVIVRLYVVNPITKEIEWNDGVGACPIQTEQGKGAMDWNYTKNNGVQLAAPCAETYAIKDAAEKFGRLFGKDLTRRDTVGYDGLLSDPIANYEDKDIAERLISSSTYDDDTKKILSDKVLGEITTSEILVMIRDLKNNQLSLKDRGYIGSMKQVDQLIDHAEKMDS